MPPSMFFDKSIWEKQKEKKIVMIIKICTTTKMADTLTERSRFQMRSVTSHNSAEKQSTRSVPINHPAILYLGLFFNNFCHNKQMNEGLLMLLMRENPSVPFYSKKKPHRKLKIGGNFLTPEVDLSSVLVFLFPFSLPSIT